MLISNQNPLLAERTLVIQMSGAHVGYSQRTMEKYGEGGLLFYAGLLKFPELLMNYYKAELFHLHYISVFNTFDLFH